MKALVLKEYNCLVYEDVPKPPIGAGEVWCKSRPAAFAVAMCMA